MYFDIIEAVYLDGYKIKLAFEDGKKGVVDLAGYVGQGVFERFRDLVYFKKYKVEHGILTWGEGELDIAPETLYCAATGEKEIIWDSYDTRPRTESALLQVREKGKQDKK